MKIKYYIPILVGLIILVIINVSIFKQENLIKTGKSIYVQLKPVDPRSLIQGDYMVLNYELGEMDSGLNFWDSRSDTFLYSTKKTIKVTLDQDGVVISSELADTPLKKDQHLLKVKSNDGSTYYPATNTFLFAEGLAYCYDDARFAEFKVRANGLALLHTLLGEDLQPLNCESKARDKDEKL